MTDAKILDHKVVEKLEGRPWGAQWLISAPWAHPLWSQYYATLADLTTDTGIPPKLYREGVTHEFLLYACNPEMPLQKLGDLKPRGLLTPANLAYQFKAGSDDEALGRISFLLNLIIAGQLSPDTDYRERTWDPHFAEDGVSLHHRSPIHRPLLKAVK